MSGLQKQEQDLAGPHSLRRQASFPGVDVDEYRGTDVYEEVWGVITVVLGPKRMFMRSIFRGGVGHPIFGPARTAPPPPPPVVANYQCNARLKGTRVSPKTRLYF